MKSNVCTLHAPTHNPSPLSPPSHIHDSKIWTRTHSQRLIVWPSECEVFLCVLQPPPPVGTRSTCQLLAVSRARLTTTHCNSLQHAATHCNAWRTATHCNTLQHNVLQRMTRSNTLQHTVTHGMWHGRGATLLICVYPLSIYICSLSTCVVYIGNH